MRKVILGALGLMLLAVSVYADYKSDVENGVKAYKNEDYQNAYKYFKAAYAVKPTENLGNYLKLAKEQYQKSTDSLLDDAGVQVNYGGWETKENLIAINPCYFALGTIALYYERKIAGNLSFGLTAGYSPTGDSWNGNFAKAYGFVIGGLINIFPEAKALNGWFVGPEFNYYRFKNEQPGNYNTTLDIVNQYFVTYGMHGGYRWILSSGFVVDLSFGILMNIGMTRTDSADPSSGGTTYMNSFSPSMGCNIGTAF